jgi:hypothetical protein
VIDAIARLTIPVRLLLGHRIDPAHVTYFPEALKIGDRLGVRSDPAYVLVAPDGTVRWKQVGMIAKKDLLRVLCSGERGPTSPSTPPCAMLHTPAAKSMDK